MYELTSEQGSAALVYYSKNFKNCTPSEAQDFYRALKNYLLVKDFYGNSYIFPVVKMDVTEQKIYLRHLANAFVCDFDEPNGCLDITFDNIQYTLIVDETCAHPRLSYYFDIYFENDTVDNFDIREILEVK